MRIVVLALLLLQSCASSRKKDVALTYEIHQVVTCERIGSMRTRTLENGKSHEHLRLKAKKYGNVVLIGNENESFVLGIIYKCDPDSYSAIVSHN